MRIDLNCDLGESFGSYTVGADEQVIPYISSANAACGFHASDPLVMEKTVKLVKQAGIAVGAHPGFPDLVGFGRRELNASDAELRAMVLYQLAALDGMCRTYGLQLQHVKPHGAMYNMAAKNPHMAAVICEAIRDFNPELILLGLAGSSMVAAAAETGIRCAQEVFADRAYEEDGTLVSRRKPGSMITDEDEAVARVIRMVREGKVTAITGKDIPITAQSVCVHGDSPEALAFVRRIRSALQENGIEICPLREIV